MPRARPRRNPYKAEIHLVDDAGKATLFRKLRKQGGPLRIPHPSVSTKGAIGELKKADKGTLVLDDFQDWSVSTIGAVADEAKDQLWDVTIIGLVDKDWHRKGRAGAPHGKVRHSIERLANFMGAKLIGFGITSKPTKKKKRHSYSAEIFYMRKSRGRGKFIESKSRDARKTGKPFRAPHPMVSRRGMYGPPHHGEVGKADGGILLLDDLQDWSPIILRGIREFIEDNGLAVRIIAVVDRDALDAMPDKTRANAERRLKKIEKIFWPSLGAPDEEEKTAAPKKKKKVPPFPVPRRSTVDIERLPARKFGSCLRCAICIAYVVNRGCCTVCGRPLSANAKRAKNPTPSNPNLELARQRGIASSFLRSIR